MDFLKILLIIICIYILVFYKWENFDQQFLDTATLSSFWNIADKIVNDPQLIGFSSIKMNSNNLYLKKNGFDVKIDDYVVDIINNNIPDGLIVSWWGNTWEIPKGWFLCDGNNGTPDLTSKFILGSIPWEAHNIGGNRYIQIKNENLPANIPYEIKLSGVEAGGYVPFDKINNSENVRFGVTDRAWNNNFEVLPGNSKFTSLKINSDSKNNIIDITPQYYSLAFIMKWQNLNTKPNVFKTNQLTKHVKYDFNNKDSNNPLILTEKYVNTQTTNQQTVKEPTTVLNNFWLNTANCDPFDKRDQDSTPVIPPSGANSGKCICGNGKIYTKTCNDNLKFDCNSICNSNSPFTNIANVLNNTKPIFNENIWINTTECRPYASENNDRTPDKKAPTSRTNSGRCECANGKIYVKDCCDPYINFNCDEICWTENIDSNNICDVVKLKNNKTNFWVNTDNNDPFGGIKPNTGTDIKKPWDRRNSGRCICKDGRLYFKTTCDTFKDFDCDTVCNKNTIDRDICRIANV